MKSDKLVKFIINMFCQYYKYNIEEFKSKENEVSFWGLSRKTEENLELVVFLDEDNFYNVDIAAAESEHKNEIVKTIKVLVRGNGNRDSSNWHHLAESYNGEMIVIDENSSRVIYYTPGTELFAQQLEGILTYNREEEEKRGKSRNISMGFITTTLVITNVVMYIFTAFLSGNPFDADVNVLINLGAKENTLIAEGQYYRFITAMFLHGGIIHIVSNMYALSAIGSAVEKAFGKVKYLLIYFLGGIISSMASFIFSEVVSVGASGAIFAILGAILVLSIRKRDRVGKAMTKNILSIIAINIFIGFTLPNIDNFAHFGGLLGGILIASVLKEQENL